MAFWLVKSEPASWSWTQMVEAGAAGTHWNGVRNHVAKKHLQAMRRGDEVFFYHSNHGKEIVGTVTVIREYYPDPSDARGAFGMVDLRALEPLRSPVGLAAIKADPALADLVLVNNSRLSVQPVTEPQWRRIRTLGGLG